MQLVHPWKISMETSGKECTEPATETSGKKSSTETSQSGTTEMKKSTESASPATKIAPIIKPENIQHFQELGLGRGIDSTDKFLWHNKAPLQVRSIADDLTNVIGTNENDILQEYEKTVSSLRSQQAKIKLAVNVPNSHVKIGLDGHYSQSTNSTVKVKGTKVQTRTISFRFNFYDVLTTLGSVRSFECDKKHGFQAFENSVATWLLDYLRQRVVTPPIDSLKGPTAIEKIEEFSSHLGSLDSDNSRLLGLGCQTFVSDIGMTHYVSSIELGALSYSVDSRKSTKTAKGIGGNLEVAASATASTSVDVSNEIRHHTRRERTIGHFDKAKRPMVEWDTSDEAVIGFKIEPISRLVRVGEVQMALNAAIQIYIQSKTDNTCKKQCMHESQYV